MGGSRTRRFLLVPFVVCVSLLALSFGPAHSVSAASPTAKSATNTPSILFILIDEASMWSLLRPDGTINANRFPGFAALAETSTWYRDTLSTAQWTWFAAPALLSGKEATFAKKPIYADWPQNIFTALGNSMKMDVQEPVTSLCPKSLCKRPMRLNRTMAPSDHVMKMYDAINRAATSTRPTLHFVHAVVPHHPWALTPEMRFSANAQNDARPGTLVDRKRDSYQSHLRQYAAVDVVIGDAIRTLKASPNWDNTMIVVTADHGLTFRPGSNIRDKVDPRKTSAMDDVFRVPLFIKYPGQATGEVSSCVTSSMDIVPTILSVVGVNPRWDFDGVDLTKGCPRRSSRRVHWPLGSAMLDTHFDEVLKTVAFYDKWIDAEGTTDDIARVGLSGSLVGSTVPATADADERIKWRLDRPSDFQTIGEGRFAPVPGRATGTYKVTTRIGKNTEGLFVVDGIVVGVVAEIAGRKKSDGWQFFSSCMLTSALRAGAHTVELWTAEWNEGVPTLRRVGPPLRVPKG